MFESVKLQFPRTSGGRNIRNLHAAAGNGTLRLEAFVDTCITTLLDICSKYRHCCANESAVSSQAEHDVILLEHALAVASASLRLSCRDNLAQPVSQQLGSLIF